MVKATCINFAVLSEWINSISNNSFFSASKSYCWPKIIPWCPQATASILTASILCASVMALDEAMVSNARACIASPARMAVASLNLR